MPGTPIHGPEQILLRTVARLTLNSDERRLLCDLVAGPLAWEYVIATAGWHGLEPLLFQHLVQSATGFVPPATMQMLRDKCQAIARNNLSLAKKLQYVSAHLSAHGIEHIVFKGPLLAETYYGNWALRVSHDLDIIVRPALLGSARDVLSEIGFRDSHGYTAAQQAASFRYGFEHSFTGDGGFELDLHWRVVPKFSARSLDMAEVWRRATTAQLFDSKVPTFCPEDLLVALCLHAGQHDWSQMSHFCDMAQVLMVHPELDWDIVRSHLGDSGSRRVVSVSFELLQRHWQVPLPEEMLVMVAGDSQVADLADRIEREIWPSPGEAGVQSNLRWILDRSAGEDLLDRLRYMTGLLLNPTLDDFDVFKLPQSLAPLYPGLRAVRLGHKYASAWLRS
jgi:hypothetical protein